MAGIEQIISGGGGEISAPIGKTKIYCLRQGTSKREER